MRPFKISTNLCRFLPERQCRRAGRPLFLSPWFLVRAPALNRSSRWLKGSGMRSPLCCDECRSRSRSPNLQSKKKSIKIFKKKKTLRKLSFPQNRVEFMSSFVQCFVKNMLQEFQQVQMSVQHEVSKQRRTSTYGHPD